MFGHPTCMDCLLYEMLQNKSLALSLPSKKKNLNFFLLLIFFLHRPSVCVEGILAILIYSYGKPTVC